MNGQRKKVALRERLFRKQRGLCHWCKQPMHLNPIIKRGQTEDPLMATLEHIHDRWSPLRGTRGKHNVAAHKSCNQQRSTVNERAALKGRAA